MIQKAFNVGNSVVLTIPFKVGIKAGTRVRFVKKEDRKLVYEVLDKTDKKGENTEKYIQEVTGAFKLSDILTPEEILNTVKELEQKPYDPTIHIS